jgi:hypothetical protein
MYRQTAIRVAALSALAAACSCNEVPQVQNSASVSYEQVGACNGFRSTTDTSGTTNVVSAGPNAAFVVFHIGAINNVNSQIAFHFDPEKMFVDESPRAFVDNNLTLAQAPGVFRAQALTAPAGSASVSVNGISVVVVRTADSNGAREANKTSYFLLYDTGAGDPAVFLSKTNANQVTFRETEACTELALPL